MPKFNLPVDPEELLYAMQVGNAAISGKMPVDNPENKGFNFIDEESGTIQKIGFTGHPMILFGFAVLQEFGDDESKFCSIMNRLMALMNLCATDKSAKPFLKSDPDGEDFTMINNVLVEVMATIPMSKDGRFNKKAFFAKVKTLLGMT